ncbi:hypothetical protein LSTR_LSTR010672 [Laodelphax striatellus]|uniref:Uncharacterized protein n=1 Tax=Laodelphax striatellus TaxID=195883 RepID=A0A482WTR4_LAOST|nr:hypothetical protein LSTR_LSTR010672 [Laodelphax striatellus]
MAFMLQTLDGFLEKGGLNQKNVQRIVETFKHAYGRRSELGDPYFTNITQLLHDLGSPEYIQRIRKSIHDGETSANYSYYGAKFNLTEDHGTANLVVLSPNGDAVSVTSTDIVRDLRKIGHKTAREPRGSGVTGIAVTDGKIYANCDKSKYGDHNGF